MSTGLQTIQRKNGPIIWTWGDDFISPMVIKSELPLVEEPEKSTSGSQQMNHCHCISIFWCSGDSEENGMRTWTAETKSSIELLFGSLLLSVFLLDVKH